MNKVKTVVFKDKNGNQNKFENELLEESMVKLIEQLQAYNAGVDVIKTVTIEYEESDDNEN